MVISSRSEILRSFACLMFVVPDVETTVLPFRSAIELMPLDFFVTYLDSDRKCAFVNDTCFARSALFVVEPHSRSTVPFAISGIRVEEVTATYLVWMLSFLSSFFTASTTLAQMS